MDKNYPFDHLAMYLCVCPHHQRPMDVINAGIKSGDLMNLPLQLAKERLELFDKIEQLKMSKRLKRLLRRVLGKKYTMIVYINHEPITFSGIDKIKRKLWRRRRFFSILNQTRGGPSVVAENLLKELEMRQDIHYDLCFREIPKNKSINVLWVVNNVDDLRWAITNKKKVGAKELWAGPNLVVVPQESGGILNSDKIDKVIVPCEWVKEVYERESADLVGKIYVWSVGVDVEFWSPLNVENNKNSNILVYNKRQDDLCMKLLPILKLHGKVNVIKYGEYTAKEYKQALDDAAFGVWLSMSESQGLALLEALSMNIPVLVWDSCQWKYYSQELKRVFVYHNASSSPYFSSQCGLKFESFEEFENKLIEFEYKMKKSEFMPREYLFDANLVVGKTLINLEEQL
jgi:glycosyltransferase involved in cell wall biosynthesis